MPARLLASAPGRAPDLPPARAYGQHRTDLDLELDRSGTGVPPVGSPTDRPALVTAILAQCCETEDAPCDAQNGRAASPNPAASSDLRRSTATPPSFSDFVPPAARAEAAWNLPLGRRIARLLRIVALSAESDALALTLRCPCAECAQAFEITLSFAQLLDSSPGETSGAEILQFPLGESALALRLPTGRDQAAWQKHTYGTAREATESIVRSLLVASPRSGTGVPPVISEDPAVTPEQLAPLAAALEEADPLVAFQVSTRCPNCERAVEIPVDLEQVALQRLAALRRSLLREIHALASRYGWNEEQILAIAPARRAEYLRLIDAEGGERP